MRVYYWTGPRPAVPGNGRMHDVGKIAREFFDLRERLAEIEPNIRGLCMSEVPAGFGGLPPGIFFRERPEVTIGWPPDHPFTGKPRFEFSPVPGEPRLLRGEPIIRKDGDCGR